jgi:hypothetical protein
MNTRVATNFDDDLVVDRDHGPPGSRFSVDKVVQSVRNFATLSEALRILGASILLASMSVFLLQGWNQGNDISRYFLLLMQTGLLTAAGFAMSHGLKEAKGARMFFGLSLVSIPANFTILGALLYSVFQWDNSLTTYPGFATWQIENVASTSATLGAAMLVLLPVTFFCFAVMARHSSKSLSVNFLLLNVLLLLPIRSSLAAGVVALAGVLYALNVVSRAAKKDRALKTAEGKFALTTLFIPAGIILFRSMYFYQVDSLLIAMVAMALYMAARQASVFPGRQNRVALTLEVLSVPLALAIAVAMTDAFQPVISVALRAPFFAIVYSLLAIDLMRRTSSRKLIGLIGATISLFVALSFVFSVAVMPSIITALLSLAAGGLLMLCGSALRNLMAVICGVITMIASVLFGLDEILRLIANSGWVELAVFGASTIALASVLDRYGVAIKLRLVKWFDAIGEQHRRIAQES